MIEKGAGSRDYPAVAGLAGAMPLTAAVVALAALSMAGLPPLFGFIGKELIYEATGHAPPGPLLVTAAAIAANALMVACAGDGGAPAVLRSRRARSPKDQPGRPRLGPLARAGDPRRARAPLRPRARR